MIHNNPDEDTKPCHIVAENLYELGLVPHESTSAFHLIWASNPLPLALFWSALGDSARRLLDIDYYKFMRTFGGFDRYLQFSLLVFEP